MIPSIVPYSDSDEEHGISKELETDKQLQFEPCPPVPNQIKKPLFYPSQTTKEISFNVPIQDLLKPVQGPMNPFINTKTNKTIMSGFMEQVVMDDDVFNKLHHRYNKDGISLDPDATNDSQFVGLNHVSGSIDTTKKNVHDSSLIDPISGERIKKQKLEREKGEQGEYVGPWASFTKDKIKELELEPEQVHYQPEKVFDSTILEQQKPMKESSVFHGQEVLDYLGRSYLHVPLDVGVDLHAPPGQIENFIPKQLIHTWTGHTKVVSQIKYFPKSAHLLLSCSMDQKVKLWDVYNDRACKRTFMGHSKGVKDVDFNYDGTQFISCGYDKFIKCWDTETGQVIHRFQTKHIPYCSTFNPTERKGHSFLVGCQDKKIYQFDTRTGEFVQEYAQHSGPINSITFIQDNTRFLSSSDDRSLRMWEFDIPVVVKYISEPDMQPIPAVELSHDRKKHIYIGSWLAAQSLDNKIMIFSVLDKFKLHRKKVFSGHLCAGNSCKPGFSTDGRFVMSGDGDGQMWFWDWKTCKVFKKFKAHDGAITNCLWHPHESSKVATSSVDGTIKFWD